ncbi:MAG: superoxide dismutase family protein [Xanthomonadales bacterium]|nr:superoxide dismutase family protein [Xanthomonadales bacterium]
MSFNHQSIVLSLAVAAALGLAACSSPSTPPAGDTVAPPATVAAPSAPVATGVQATAPAAQVVLKPTQGHDANGTLTLRAEGDGVRISGELAGLKPGSEHGFHVHENGDCSAPDATSAGGHFNPAGQAHGSMDADPHHVGDMPNQLANAQGVADVDVLVHDMSLTPGSEHDVIGRALVVHEQPDDYQSQPSGNAGARIACGVIVAAAAPQG